jgi:multidrug efflux pump subunit AcrA (membrane-fusion protein)
MRILALLLLASTAVAAPVKRYKVERHDLKVTLKVSAVLAAHELAALAAPAAGIVQTVSTDVAHRVKKGDQIATIASSKGGKVVVAAPFDGIVITRAAVIGVFVPEGAPLATVASDLTKLRAELEVPELASTMIHIGVPVTLTFDALPGKVYSATLATRVPWIDTRTRTQHAEAEVANPDLSLLPGLSGVATGVTNQRSGLAIPGVAIGHDGEKAYVFRAVNGKAVKTPIQAGIVDGDFVEVLSGLNEKDEALVGVKEGDSVTN